MIKVVLDTNILVSGTFWTGNSFKIMELIDENKILSITSKDIIDEYYFVINSDEIIYKIENKDLIASDVSKKIILNSIIVKPEIKIDISEDSEDNKILECAYEGKVDYIITKDNHLLKLKRFKNIKIVTPEEFLKLFK